MGLKGSFGVQGCAQARGDLYKSHPLRLSLKNFYSENISRSVKPINTVDMHTTGEPTRIVYSGFPVLSGTLLKPRAQAKRDYDHF